MKKNIKHLPFTFYYLQAFFIVLSGLINSSYLAFSHYKNFTDIGYSSFCAISKKINCDTVSQSKYSVLGGLPISVWGILGYCLLFILLLIAGHKSSDCKRPWALIIIISLFFSLYSTFLAFISGYYIKSYCILCILSYLINFLILYYAWFIRRRFDEDNIIVALIKDYKSSVRNWKIMTSFFLLIIITSLLWLYLPKYWVLKPVAVIDSDLDTGITDDGHPWIGSKKPKLTITEFSDYRCFQCKKIHYYLRQLVSANHDKIRLIHRHYPMDHKFNPLVVPEPFHEGAGMLAMIASYASIKGKFWEVNDALFNLDHSKSTYTLGELSDITGLSKQDIYFAVNSKKIKNIVGLDILQGMKNRITATPALLIDGNLYIGQIPSEIIKEKLDE